MEQKTFMTVQEVADEMGISKSSAYKIVRKLNEELAGLGFITVSGRVNREFFKKKCCYSDR